MTNEEYQALYENYNSYTLLHEGVGENQSFDVEDFDCLLSVVKLISIDDAVTPIVSVFEVDKDTIDNDGNWFLATTGQFNNDNFQDVEYFLRYRIEKISTGYRVALLPIHVAYTKPSGSYVFPMADQKNFPASYRYVIGYTAYTYEYAIRWRLYGR